MTLEEFHKLWSEDGTRLVEHDSQEKRLPVDSLRRLFPRVNSRLRATCGIAPEDRWPGLPGSTGGSFLLPLGLE